MLSQLRRLACDRTTLLAKASPAAPLAVGAAREVVAVGAILDGYASRLKGGNP